MGFEATENGQGGLAFRTRGGREVGHGFWTVGGGGGEALCGLRGFGYGVEVAEAMAAIAHTATMTRFGFITHLVCKSAERTSARSQFYSLTQQNPRRAGGNSKVLLGNGIS